MTNNFQIFKHETLGEIRGLVINNEPWFVGKDVATTLGYSDLNKAIAMHVDEDDKLNDKTALNLGQRGGWLINESGLYSLIFSSKLPNAKKVKSWIKRDVLPILREHNSPAKNDDNTSESFVNAPYMDKKCAIQAFENPEFGEIRGIEINGEPWLVGKDIAAALGYTKPENAIASHVNDEDKGVTKMMTPGGLQQVVIINESGLYSLIFSSKLPGAKQFTHWVTSEVLPSIRKTGMYISGSQYDISVFSPEVQMAKKLLESIMRTELEQKRQAEEQARQAAEQERIAQEQARQAEEQKRMADEQERQAAEQKRQAQEQEQHTEALQIVDRKLEDIRDVVVTRPETWRKDCLHLVAAIAQKRGGDAKAYQDTNIEIFNLVDQRAHVSLQTRLTNRLNRMKAEGAGKSKQKKLNKVDIIAEDNKLIEIYIAIIKEMCIQYEVSPSILEEAQDA